MSLYETMKRKLGEKTSGCLYITNNTDGREGRIILVCGKIRAILVGEDISDELNLLKWINISLSFSDKIPNIDLAAIRAIDTEKFMDALVKADAWINMVKKIIPGNHAVFRTIGMPSSRYEGFDARKLQISLVLKEKKTVSQVTDITGMTEREVLSGICWLHNHGLVELLSAESVFGKKKTDFLNVFRERLTDLIGPVANMVMEDAFESIGTDNPDNLEFFSESLIIELQNAVCQQIDEK
ncbi:MAG: hypothetical protein GY750_18790, partial [Lentisphaerae bacterium]|nr:hypothetical protein [Lentisphaerota bacterium]